MTRRHLSLTIVAVALLLTGCGTFNSLTGQTDNTVLPGQREDAIPGRAQFPDQPDPLVASPAAEAPQQAGQAEPPSSMAGSSGTVECQPDDPACQPAAQDGVFSDPQ